MAARAGYEVMDGVLGYGLIGVEGSRVKVNVPVLGLSETVADYGIRYGVGVESFVNKNWTVRSEVSLIDWKGKSDLPKSEEIRATVGVGYHF
jgi:opacity protein-like surface antigen